MYKAAPTLEHTNVLPPLVQPSSSMCYNSYIILYSHIHMHRFVLSYRECDNLSETNLYNVDMHNEAATIPVCKQTLISTCMGFE